MYGSGQQVKHRLAEHLLYTADKLENGQPSIYRLYMKEGNRHANSMFARRSIGFPNGRGEKVFLLVGATGAGKSTLINGMVNYILGVEWKDDFRFKVITEESQTTDITAYTFHPMEHSPIQYTFTIIDTPGFDATEGLKRDKEVAEQIKKCFSDETPERINHVDGIGFVAHASQTSLTSSQEYIFDFIQSIFGKDGYKNIVMMLTFADCRRPPVLNAIVNRPQIRSNQFVKFNNLGIFAENSSSWVGCKADQTFNEMFWKISFISFKDFFELFSVMSSRPLGHSSLHIVT